MSMKHIIWARESRSQGPTRSVYQALAGAANDPEDMCFPSVNTLCKWSGFSKSTVLIAIAELVALGELRVIKRNGSGSKYVLVEPQPVSEGHRYQSDTGIRVTPHRYQSNTTPVSEQHHTGVALTPVKVFKEQLKVETGIPGVSEVVFAAETAQTTQPDDDGYKGQSATWVDPNPISAGALWEAIKLECQNSLTNGVSHHVLQTQVIAFDGDVLRVQVNSIFAFEALTGGRLQAAMNRFAHSMAGRPLTVRFEQQVYQPRPELLGVTR